MSALANLKLIVAKKQNKLSPVMQRRQKLLKRLGEQMELATAKQGGSVYAPTKQRKVTDAETGDRKVISVPKRIKEWWFLAGDNKLALSVSYGSKVIELAKGKTAVELQSVDQLLPTLATLKQAVENGELDAQLEAVSGATKAGFKK